MLNVEYFFVVFQFFLFFFYFFYLFIFHIHLIQGITQSVWIGISRPLDQKSFRQKISYNLLFKNY